MKNLDPRIAKGLMAAALMMVIHMPLFSQETLPGGSRPDLDFSDADSHARSAPAALRRNLDDLAEYLGAFSPNPWMKARVIYIWLTANIAYDTDCFFSGRRSDVSPEGVLASGKSVCSGYAGLFTALADRMDLEAILISGWAKGYGYRPGTTFNRTNHAWNAVRIEGAWYLMDATWGAGFVEERRFVRYFDDYWFAPSPEEFRVTHLPVQSRYQISQPLFSKAEYEAFPYVKPTFFKSGFSYEDLLWLDSRKKNPVTIYDMEAKHDFPFYVVEAPVMETLRADEEVTFRLLLPQKEGLKGSFINNKEWIPMEKTPPPEEIEGGSFSPFFYYEATLAPQRGTLKVSFQIPQKGRVFWTFLEYKVQ